MVDSELDFGGGHLFHYMALKLLFAIGNIAIWGGNGLPPPGSVPSCWKFIYITWTEFSDPQLEIITINDLSSVSEKSNNVSDF